MASIERVASIELYVQDGVWYVETIIKRAAIKYGLRPWKYGGAVHVTPRGVESGADAKLIVAELREAGNAVVNEARALVLQPPLWDNLPSD